MSASFAARLIIVDDTYWDDGQRWTHRWHSFDTLAEAVKFKRDLEKVGRYTTISRQTNEEFTKCVDDDTIKLFRVDGDRKTQLKAADIVTLLGQVANG